MITSSADIDTIEDIKFSLEQSATANLSEALKHVQAATDCIFLLNQTPINLHTIDIHELHRDMDKLGDLLLACRNQCVQLKHGHGGSISNDN